MADSGAGAIRMNLLRQREKLKEMHRAGMVPNRALYLALSSPVFEWDRRDEQEGRTFVGAEAQFLNEHIADSKGLPKVAPFDCFRISRRNCFDQWFKEQTPLGFRWTLVRCTYGEKGALSEGEFTRRVLRNETGNLVRLMPEHWVQVIFDPDDGGLVSYRAWVFGRELDPKHLCEGDSKQATLGGLIAGFRDTLLIFLFETFWPGNTILRVEPPIPKGDARSVEWRLARTHWLVLNRKQAQRCQQERRGPTEGELTRAAHWRIAHLRRLKSDRFKPEKRGKLIKVKQAWVGPLSWVGLDGKIYKVEHI